MGSRGRALRKADAQFAVLAQLLALRHGYELRDEELLFAVTPAACRSSTATLNEFRTRPLSGAGTAGWLGTESLRRAILVSVYPCDE